MPLCQQAKTCAQHDEAATSERADMVRRLLGGASLQAVRQQAGSPAPDLQRIWADQVPRPGGVPVAAAPLRGSRGERPVCQGQRGDLTSADRLHQASVHQEWGAQGAVPLRFDPGWAMPRMQRHNLVLVDGYTPS